MPGDPPPFIPADTRISPSGPFLTGGLGNFVRFGADAIVGQEANGDSAVFLTDTGGLIIPVPRVQPPVPPDVPLAVSFPAWESSDVLWIVWHLNGSWIAAIEGGNASILSVWPTVDLGDGVGPQFINNASETTYWDDTIAVGGLTGQFLMSGTAAIRLVNPTLPPIVQLFYSLGAFPTGATDASVVINGAHNLVGTVPSPSSGWLTAAELLGSTVFQLPADVNLSPVTP